MVRDALEDGGLARTAGALGARGQHTDTGLLDDIEDGALRRYDEREVTARQDDLEGVRANGFGERLGREPLDVQAAARPGVTALLDGVEQWLRAAAVDQRVRSWVVEEVSERQETALVLWPQLDLVVAMMK